MTGARRKPATVALGLALLLVVAACGQKPGTHVTAPTVVVGAGQAVGPQATVPPVTAAPGSPAPTPPPPTGVAAPPTAGPRPTRPPATRPDPSGADASGTQAAGGGATVTGDDRTGVTADSLVLAVHAPVTGAAPLPATSFQQSRDLYWRWLTEAQGQKVLGRSKVQVLFRDDRYQPSTAVQVCRELAAQAFVVVGGGGTDQIQACGRYANGAGVPYFSAGVTERDLRGLPWYFAASMSYKQQGVLLAQYVARTYPGKKVAAVITDTPNFDDAVEGWEAGVAQHRVPYYKTLRHPKGDTSWYNTFASELSGAGVEVLYILSAPVDYIRFAQQGGQQGFNPQYVGVGVSMGLNAVLAAGCPDVDGGVFFSPFPGLDWARQHEPAFFQAAQRFGTPSDDLSLALWGFGKLSHELFKRYGQTYGNDLTREDYRALVERQRDVASSVFPTLSFSPNDHFGARQVHVLRADCARGEHVTLAPFASGF